MTTDWTSIDFDYTLGPELVTNGGFVGSAAGWTLNTGWAYGSNNIVHTPGNGQSATQAITTTVGELYTISFTIGGTTENVNALFAGSDTVAAAGSGIVEYQIRSTEASTSITFNPASDTDATITSVSIMRLIPTQWTDLAKPSGTSYTKLTKASGTSYTDIAKPSTGTVVSYGTPIGLLLALTREISVTTDSWTSIAEPSTSWTDIPKAV